ncbi:MAG: MASE1 domain-containing sensor histidine kinase [Providencia sp.]|uniref:MASE1 domain-containing sensor histidine kinase n=1 Tax=Providencia sp. TaxID=589 RepID=UPI003F9D1AEB
MTKSTRLLLQSIFLLFTYSLIWIGLWIIGFYLSQNSFQATLFLPQGLRLALMIILWRRYWPTLLLCEGLLNYWLAEEQLLTQPILLLSPLLSLCVAFIIQHIWWRYTLYWQRLLLLLAGVAANSVLHALLFSWLSQFSISQLFLTTFTGGILLSPFVYLIYEYLHEQHYQMLLDYGTSDKQLRTSLIVWCFLFFVVGLSAQVFFAPEIERLIILLVFIPNVFMAYRYGWQGGVLSALLGSLIITFARQFHGAFADLQELEMFLSTQALIGIGLGIAISRQKQLAGNLQQYRQRLEQELKARRDLMRQLVHTEEDIKKAIARELHDEIGQNITAIQIQSMLVKKTATDSLSNQAASQINELAQQIHQSTRQLLRQLRPPVLNEMSLEKALTHLIAEFSFEENNIQCDFHYGLQETPANETILFTLYRLVQELLNNISKHAKATQIQISLEQYGDSIQLIVNDNGVGIPFSKRTSGFGLRGIEERIRALGGDWTLTTQGGTKIIVNLPTL